jgi:osmoprotectant transport system permease protein
MDKSCADHTELLLRTDTKFVGLRETLESQGARTAAYPLEEPMRRTPGALKFHGFTLLLTMLWCLPAWAEPLVVSSKVFTESVILGEIATQLLQATRIEARHQRELGGTRVLWSALQRGDVDCYAEYSGTLRAEIFAREPVASDGQLRAALAKNGVWQSAPLGFNNTYVIGVPADLARRLDLSKVSQLEQQPQLRFGFSNEFLQRGDGWPGLRQHYGLPQTQVSGLAHELAYRALADGAIDATDLYSTDAEIPRYQLVTLADDKQFFPEYQAAFLCRASVPEGAREALQRLAGRIDAARMAGLNARARLDGVAESAVAADFLREQLQLSASVADDDRTARMARHTAEHLVMVLVSLLAACLIAIPLGILAWRRPFAGRIVFAVADVLQTVPALALLVFLIPWLGIGYAPAVFALFIYSVLPILRNTHTGLLDIPRDLLESAEVLGLSRTARLRHIELPLAARSIIGGIKTAAVINVGTATLGALIGAGGYGQPILTGIRLDDLGLILEGAIPAALLALAAQVCFGYLERRVVRQK